MDKISGDLKSIAPAVAITNNKLDTKSTVAHQGYSSITRNKNIAVNKTLRQRSVVEVDNQFCKLSVTRSENYKKVLELLIAKLRQNESAAYDEAKLRRVAHIILQLYLPKKQSKAKQTLADILINKDMLELIANNSRKNCIEIAYEYLLKNQNIPESYLQNEIFQYLTDQWFADLKDSNDAKLEEIKQHAIAVDIKTAKDFTFKRFLRLKKRLARYYDVPANYKDTTDIHPKQGVIALDSPEKSKYYLDDIDKAFINKQITDNSYAKTHKYDLLHRIKRKILHSKRDIAQNALAVFVVGIIGSAATFGASFIFSVCFGVAWLLFLKPIEMLYKYTLYRYHYNKTEQQKLSIDNINTLTVENKKELRKFITSCSYMCRYDSMANLIGCFSELEKSAEKLKQIHNKQNKSVKDDIEYEQLKVIYQLRKQDLQQQLAGFINITSDIINTAKPDVLELTSNLDQLWNSKFNNLSAIEQQSIFLKVLNKRSMASYKNKLTANNNALMTKVLPFLAGNSDREAIAKIAMDDIDKLLEAEPIENKQKAFKKISGVLHNIKSVFTDMSLDYLKSRFKVLGFYAIRGSVYLRNQVPALIEELKSSVMFGIDWMLIIGFTILGIAVDDINNRINQRKLNKYKQGEKVTTGVLIIREQTAREELYLMHNETIKKLDAIQKQMSSFFENCNSLKQEMLNHETIESMDDETAAECFIKYMCLKQELDETLLQAFGGFYQNVLTKTASIEESLLQQGISEF